jgi:hypothetical protein
MAGVGIRWNTIPTVDLLGHLHDRFSPIPR